MPRHFEALAAVLMGPQRRALVCALLACLLSLSPVRELLLARMSTHMGLQIPALVALGWLMRSALPLQRLYRWRLGLLLLALGTLTVWMLPRLLDLAVQDRAVDLSKSASLVLLAGLPLGCAWAHLGFVWRAALHLEALATLWRLGWLYLDSPVRLCSNYGWSDQQTLGRGLLMAGVVYATWLAWQALRTRPNTVPTEAGNLT
ncbi:hypothetical protein ACG0Z6_01995 [Roseateles sp. BYS180W]|uniref:Transmembrane protein n=1 Tax=Roseateles rivi TaxID=3299028 RepID=A0ABW7FRQ0_9BURK